MGVEDVRRESNRARRLQEGACSNSAICVSAPDRTKQQEVRLTRETFVAPVCACSRVEAFSALLWARPKWSAEELYRPC